VPTLEELLNPDGEDEIGDSPHRFPGGDDEILAEAVKQTPGDNPDVINEESDRDSDPEDSDGLSYQEGAALCERLEKACIIHADADGVSVLDLQKQLRKMRGHFQQLEFAAQKQCTLDKFWSI
jgi:hypothetical protein